MDRKKQPKAITRFLPTKHWSEAEALGPTVPQPTETTFHAKQEKKIENLGGKVSALCPFSPSLFSFWFGVFFPFCSNIVWCIKILLFVAFILQSLLCQDNVSTHTFLVDFSHVTLLVYLSKLWYLSTFITEKMLSGLRLVTKKRADCCHTRSTFF